MHDLKNVWDPLNLPDGETLPIHYTKLGLKASVEKGTPKCTLRIWKAGNEHMEDTMLCSFEIGQRPIQDSTIPDVASIMSTVPEGLITQLNDLSFVEVGTWVPDDLDPHVTKHANGTNTVRFVSETCITIVAEVTHVLEVPSALSGFSTLATHRVAADGVDGRTGYVSLFLINTHTNEGVAEAHMPVGEDDRDWTHAMGLLNDRLALVYAQLNTPEEDL